MTDTTHDLETAMLASLHGISTHWDAMLTPTSSGGQGGSQSARITADDHADTEADIDRATRIVSLRRFTVDVLNGWSRVVMEDRPVTKALPDGSDAKGMCVFLERHAQWMSGHEAAEDCAGELADIARRIDNLVTPKRREWVPLGDCPVTVADAKGNSVVCGTPLRAYPDDDDIHRFVTCKGCGTEDTIDWWMSQIVPEASELVPIGTIIAAVAARTHRILTSGLIRQWAHLGHVQRHGKDLKGRTLYSVAAVLAYSERGEREEAA